MLIPLFWRCPKLKRSRCTTYISKKFDFLPLQIFSSQAVLQSCCCCNLSGGVALIVWFTTNGMCAKNKNIFMWPEHAIIEWSRWSDLGEWPLMMLVNLVNSWLCLLMVTTRVISSGDLYCCLLPRCKSLRTCRSGFPIATLSRVDLC